MNVVEQIYLSSPWLTEKSWMSKDRHLTMARDSGICFRHLDEKVSFPPGSISIIRGPRQIGKSTECKLIIKSHLEKGSNPKNFVYFPCDNILNRRELVDVVTASKEITKSEDNHSLTLFLDEITSVKEWYKTIKWFQDTGMLSKVALVLTGSSAYEMKRGYERMPGRRRGGVDICLLPMGYKAFSDIMSSVSVPTISLWEMIDSEKAFNHHKALFLGKQTVLSKNIEMFLRYGGIPCIVAEIKNNRDIAQATKEIFFSTISSEIEKQKRSTATLRMVLNGIYSSLTTPVSLNRIAASQNISSPTTVKEYLELLHSSFICFPVSPLDISKKAAFPKKDKKYYFTDPLFLDLIQSAFSLQEIDLSRLAELSAGAAIIRHFAEDWARWGYVDSLFYWKSSSNREVDFVISRRGLYFGIEVKYQSQVSGWDELSILRGIGKGLLVTKDTFEFGTVPKIPLWVFLLLKI